MEDSWIIQSQPSKSQRLMAANSTGLSWDPWSTFGGEATSSSERSTHVNLQLAIKTPSMPLEPINAAQQTAAHIPGCDEDSNPCTSVRRLGPSPTFKNDIFPCDNSTSLLSHADWGYTCDTSFGESLMVEASSRDSFIPDQYFDTMRYPNHPRPLSKSNTLTFDGLAFSADTYAVQNTQEDSKSAHSLGNGPSVKGSNVDLNDNGSNTGEDSTVPESAVMGDTLALGGLDSSINMCTVEHRPKNSKEVSASSRSLLADSLDKSPSAKEPKGISDDHDSNAGGDPNTSKSPSPPEREKSASRGIDSSVDGCTGANESRSRSLSAKSPVDGKSRMEPIIIPDGDDSNSLWLDRPSVATQSLKLANKGPIAPEKSLPISDVAAKRSRTPNIPTGVEKRWKRPRCDSSRNTYLTDQDIHQQYREFRDSDVALELVVKDMLKGKNEDECKEFERAFQAKVQAQEAFESKFELFEEKRMKPSRRRYKKVLNA